VGRAEIKGDEMSMENLPEAFLPSRRAAQRTSEVLRLMPGMPFFSV